MGSIDLSTADYLAQLLKDKKQLSAFPNVFIHVERLLDKEIGEVREKLFNIRNDCPELPEPMGNIVCISEKIYIPVNQYPDFNFVGRILGPRGMTAKQLETDTGCKIMVRGKGSMRDKVKEDHMKDKPNWEHLNDDLHVLVSCEDYESRAPVKLKAAVDQINRLLIPQPDGEDDLKKKQLIELAILNGTYRDNTFPQKFGVLPPGNNRLAAAIGAPLIIASPRMTHAAPITSFFPAPTISHEQTQAPTYFYIPTPAPLDAFAAPAVIDYASLSIENSSGAAFCGIMTN